MLIDVDPALFGEAAPVSDGFEAVAAFEPYMAARLAEGVRLHDMTRHLLGLFPGRPGARLWRRHLATEAPKRNAGLEVVREAIDHLRREEARLRQLRPHWALALSLELQKASTFVSVRGEAASRDRHRFRCSLEPVDHR